jgi:hypothetical protein
MKEFRLFLAAACLVVMAGCSSDNSMTQAEIDSLKHSRQPTPEEVRKVTAGMAQGAKQAQQSQADWAKQHPEEAAKINAERAKMGRPPLGGG